MTAADAKRLVEETTAKAVERELEKVYVAIDAAAKRGLYAIQFTVDRADVGKAMKSKLTTNGFNCHGDKDDLKYGVSWA